MAKKREVKTGKPDSKYKSVFGDVASIIEAARRSTARSVNSIMTAAYWLIGRRIVEFEQYGKKRAEYGKILIEKLAADLSSHYGKGFSVRNVWQMRSLYLAWPILQTPSAESSLTSQKIPHTLSGKSDIPPSMKSTAHDIPQTASAESSLASIAGYFPLPWSAYVRLLSVKNKKARRFYETEALRGGWSVRQLDRQINSQFYERTALSRNKAAMLKKGEKKVSGDIVTAEEEIKDPYVLEFLGLKDEYSETDLEDALIRHLETFLLELGGDFCFIGRQKRLRIGDEWYRVDLVFFHRRLRCLVIIDLKIGRFTHADAGQMHLYLNYAREHWMRKDENPPVGLILCAQKDKAVARYALEGLSNKVIAAEYRTALPNEKILVAEIKRTQEILQKQRAIPLPVVKETKTRKSAAKKRNAKKTKGKRRCT